MGNYNLDYNKAVLISVCTDRRKYEDTEHSLNELERLANTAGIEVAGKHIQMRKSINSSTYAGTGFIERIKRFMQMDGAGLLIFDNDLSPSQGRNLKNDFDIDSLDRTELILDIFHKHAKTNEAKLQIKLAELQYELPRLKRLWTHLDREKGTASGGAGGATARGMGEKQIEIDKRLIRDDIEKIKKKLDKILVQKKTQRKRREKINKICLVGYTNAGKSTLFNRITDSTVLVEDKLFATLGSTTTQHSLGKGREVVFSDTVGFISNLPHHLVASFRATLKEVVDADLLLHTIDISNPNADKLIAVVNEVLEQIGADKLRQLLVFNKIDKVDQFRIKHFSNMYPGALFVSARKNKNIDELLNRIDNTVFDLKEKEIFIPHAQAKTISELYNLAEIKNEKADEKGVNFHIEITELHWKKFKEKKYIKEVRI